jgi:PhnB protein
MPEGSGESNSGRPAQGSSRRRADVREAFPYLCIRDAAGAIDFYREVFGATERLRMDTDGGRVAHAELAFGPTVIMISDEYPEVGIRGPLHWGGTPVRLHLHVDDVDGLAQRAQAAGATILRGPRDEAHGERQCLLRDPWGHEWLLGDG